MEHIGSLVTRGSLRQESVDVLAFAGDETVVDGQSSCKRGQAPVPMPTRLYGLRISGIVSVRSMMPVTAWPCRSQPRPGVQGPP